MLKVLKNVENWWQYGGFIVGVYGVFTPPDVAESNQDKETTS